MKWTFDLLPIIFSCLLFNLGTTTTDPDCPYVYTSEDRRTNKDALRIVQYNTEWLFLDYYANADCPGNGCPWKNQSMAETHFTNVQQIISDLNPDIINLCEIECCDELNELVENIEDNTYKPYVKQGTDTSTGQNVGILTRIDPTTDLARTETRVNYPIPGSKCGYTGSPGSSGVSKHYITEFKIMNSNENIHLDIVFIGAHLLAYPTDPSRCVQREAQAQVLQYVIMKYIQNGFEVIFMGDLNDYDLEVPDINSHKPISKTLDILKGIEGEYHGEYELTNVAEYIQQSNRYSDWWDSDNNCNTQSQQDLSMIDHVLVTPLLTNYIDNVFVYHAYEEYCGKMNSDHYPVVIDLVFE